MIIVIGNQKGGAGTSTLALLLANYLAVERRRKVTVLDMAHHKAIRSKAEKAKILENEPLYEVLAVDACDCGNLMNNSISKDERIVLVDFPKRMDHNELVPVLSNAQAFLCPFSYDEATVDCTVLFALIVRKINLRAPLLFVPNRIKTSARYELKNDVDKSLRRLGAVVPAIPDRIDIHRVNTLGTPEDIRQLLNPIFDLVYEQYVDGRSATM
ncbi:nucleotide-binding protein [Sphingobacterium suaedae]|uniref:AAA family ATPase n=1 Tax=Sphingobacterium suaedae TaxID=1686402 RepID=A0ABW5KJS3_9SPHI